MLKQGEIKSLTGLRGVAACWVVLFHYVTAFHHAYLGRDLGARSSVGFRLFEAIVLHGYLAVDLFFVLSGFVMALTYGEAFTARLSARTYLEFLAKRLGRIYPLYIAATVAVTVLDYTGAVTAVLPSPMDLASNALLVQAWGMADSIVIPAWSISTEFTSYLLFPLLVRLVLVGRWARCWAASAAAALALVLVATRTTAELHQVIGGTSYRGGPLDATKFSTIYPLLRCFAGFTLGLLAFRLTEAASVRRVLAAPLVGDLGLLALLALVVVPGSDVVLVLLFVPFVAALATGRSYAAACLSRGVLYWLGLVSYSIYLNHYPAADLLRFPVQAALAALGVPHVIAASGLAVLVPILALSAATYYAIEKPGRAWVRKALGRRPGLPIGSEPAAP